MTNTSIIDRQRERGQEWLEKLLHLTKIPANVTAEIQKIDPSNESSESENEANACWLTIDNSQLTPAQINILIGENGMVLDAIQYLANATLNLNTLALEEHASYIIELNGYRIKRQAELHHLANITVEKVRETGREVELKSLSSAERRQIHTFLQDYEDVETLSRGEEPNRNLVVKLR